MAPPRQPAPVQQPHNAQQQQNAQQQHILQQPPNPQQPQPPQVQGQNLNQPPPNLQGGQNAPQAPNPNQQNLTKEDILIIDKDFPELPEFKYEELAQKKSATVSRTTDQVRELQRIHSQYDTVSLQVSAIEMANPIRSARQTTVILKMRQQLFTLYEKAEKIAATLDGILEVQRASRPDLPIPEDHPQRNGVLGDFYAFIKQIKKERDASLSPNELIAEQWRMAAYFADQHLISHKQFLTGVSSLLSRETFEYVRKLPKDTPLKTVAESSLFPFRGK